MRTRIALVAVVSTAVVTVSLLSQLVAVQPARAAIVAPQRTAPPAAGRHGRLTSVVTAGTTATTTGLFWAPGAVLLAGAPVRAAAAPAPSDTVTPAQRAAWGRVAMCEEGGNWHADGSRFSGGLGITRTNWAAYGGLQYAPSGATATPDQQIMVAERIQSTAPDQYGCRGW